MAIIKYFLNAACVSLPSSPFLDRGGCWVRWSFGLTQCICACILIQKGDIFLVFLVQQCFPRSQGMLPGSACKHLFIKPAEQGGCAGCLLSGGVLSASHLHTHTWWQEAKTLKHKLDCHGWSVSKRAEAVDLQRPVASEEITLVHSMQIWYSCLKELLFLLPLLRDCVSK